MRYIGTGGTGVTTDNNTVPAEHFTFSTMVLPAGCEGPLHLHTDAEEVFFVLRGNKLRFIIEQGRALRDRPEGARPVLRPARRLSRVVNKGRGSADVRDDR